MFTTTGQGLALLGLTTFRPHSFLFFFVPQKLEWGRTSHRDRSLCIMYGDTRFQTLTGTGGRLSHLGIADMMTEIVCKEKGDV